MMEHPNVISIKEYFEDETQIFIVTELVRGGNLHNFSKNYKLQEEQIALIMH